MASRSVFSGPGRPILFAPLAAPVQELPEPPAPLDIPILLAPSDLHPRKFFQGKRGTMPSPGDLAWRRTVPQSTAQRLPSLAPHRDPTLLPCPVHTTHATGWDILRSHF